MTNAKDGSADRYLETRLEESLGARAPDLTDRILAAGAHERRAASEHLATASAAEERWNGAPSRTRWARLAAAAVVLLGLGVVATVALWQGGPPDGAADNDTSPAAADPDLQDGDPDKVVFPKTLAELRGLLERTERISVRTVFTREHSVEVRRDETSMLQVTDRPTIDAVLAAVDEPMQKVLPAGWIWPNVVVFHLDQGRTVRSSLAQYDERRFGVAGLGDHAAPPALVDVLQPLVERSAWRARRLQGIVFGGDELRRVGPEGFDAGLTELRAFDLTADDLPGLARFEQLRELDLSGCRKTLGGADLTRLPALPTLRVLRFRQAKLDDDGLRALASLPDLRALELERVELTGQQAGVGFAALEQHERLRTLDLSWAQGLSAEGLMTLAKLTSLERLDLSGKSLASVGDMGLARFFRPQQRLVALDLSDSPLHLDGAFAGPIGLVMTAVIPPLENRDRADPATGRPLGIENLRALEELDLSDTSVSVQGLQLLPASGALRALRLARCERVEARAVAALSRLRGLRELDLSQCPGVAQADLAHLANLPLRKLALEQVKLSPTAFEALARLPHIEELDIGFTGADDRALEAFEATRAPLRRLALTGCDGVTDAGLRHLHPLSNLESLDLNVCDGITAEGIAALREALPGCELRLPSRLR